MHQRAHRDPYPDEGEAGRLVDVDKAREHFDNRAARARPFARARGARLVAGYYIGTLAVFAVLVIAWLTGVRIG